MSTTPVVGVLLVDGQASPGIAARANPVGQAGDMSPRSGVTDENGKFAFSTYESGDGLVAGEYKLTFEWVRMNPMTKRSIGDRLKGRYADPEASEHVIQVKDGEPLDLGAIVLSLED